MKPAPLSGEVGLPLISAYSPDHRDASSQSFAVAQDTSGVIYLGNLGGLFAYAAFRDHGMKKLKQSLATAWKVLAGRLLRRRIALAIECRLHRRAKAGNDDFTELGGCTSCCSRRLLRHGGRVTEDCRQRRGGHHRGTSGAACAFLDSMRHSFSIPMQSCTRPGTAIYLERTRPFDAHSTQIFRSPPLHRRRASHES